jgi:D-amino peptidase
VKIYLLCDMEGASGIWRVEQTDKAFPDYEHGRELLMGDVNAAVEGCFDGGATGLVVCDTHGGGPNFLIQRMDPRPCYETPCAASPLPSLDGSFGGLILMCHHAMAGTQDAFLDHTQSSEHWFDYRINGESYGEIGQESAYAGHYRVPLIMVTGDEAACAETRRQFPGAVAVPVKRGLGRNRAFCLHPERAHELIRTGAAEAVRSAGSMQPFRPALPATLELTFYRTDMADAAAARPGNERSGPRTVRRRIQTATEVLSI